MYEFDIGKRGARSRDLGTTEGEGNKKGGR